MKRLLASLSKPREQRRQERIEGHAASAQTRLDRTLESSEVTLQTIQSQKRAIGMRIRRQGGKITELDRLQLQSLRERERLMQKTMIATSRMANLTTSTIIQFNQCKAMGETARAMKDVSFAMKQQMKAIGDPTAIIRDMERTQAQMERLTESMVAEGDGPMLDGYVTGASQGLSDSDILAELDGLGTLDMGDYRDDQITYSEPQTERNPDSELDRF